MLNIISIVIYAKFFDKINLLTNHTCLNFVRSLPCKTLSQWTTHSL